MFVRCIPILLRFFSPTVGVEASQRALRRPVPAVLRTCGRKYVSRYCTRLVQPRVVYAVSTTQQYSSHFGFFAVSSTVVTDALRQISGGEYG